LSTIKEGPQSLETRREAWNGLAQSLWRKNGPADILISDLLLGLRENKLQLFENTKLVVICYSGHRKLNRERVSRGPRGLAS
jgi:hypothetical protein